MHSALKHNEDMLASDRNVLGCSSETFRKRSQLIWPSDDPRTALKNLRKFLENAWKLWKIAEFFFFFLCSPYNKKEELHGNLKMWIFFHHELESPNIAKWKQLSSLYFSPSFLVGEFNSRLLCKEWLIPDE